jgi:hypothetical protein
MLRLLSDLAARRRAELAAPAVAAGESTVTA